MRSACCVVLRLTVPLAFCLPMVIEPSPVILPMVMASPVEACTFKLLSLVTVASILESIILTVPALLVMKSPLNPDTLDTLDIVNSWVPSIVIPPLLSPVISLLLPLTMRLLARVPISSSA